MLARSIHAASKLISKSGVVAQSSGETVVQNVGLELPRREAIDADVFEDGVTYRDARARAEAAFERRFVTWIFQKNGGNIAAAAREAKMDRKYLGDLVRKHGRQ